VYECGLISGPGTKTDSQCVPANPISPVGGPISDLLLDGISSAPPS